ncbi:MAG: hypothetical protein GF368_03355, partial [Candidatus Aenigmarchaeota archaeon]|nr:hypothetical protein [Candidatus Aenigmarchaeota archaeon]
MKIKKLIFLSLVLGLVIISGCTSSTKITGGGGSVKASLLNILDIVIGWSDQKFIFQLINNRMKITLDPFRARLLLGIALLTSWMLIYGFLSELRIFGRGKTALYLILSFLIAETGSITGIIPWVALFMYTAINAWSI